MDGKGFQKLVWLFMQMLNLSTHIWVEFLAAFLHLDLGKAAPAGYFELGAGLDFCLLLLGLGQAFVDSSYSSEITCWTIFCTSALNLPSHLWYISGDKMEVMRHTLAVLRPGMALSIDKLTGYLDVSCHVIATSAILNEVFASAYGMSTVLCIVSSAALVSSIACLGSLRLLHPALEHIDKGRTQRQKLTRTASMDTLHLAMKKKRAREERERLDARLSLGWFATPLQGDSTEWGGHPRVKRVVLNEPRGGNRQRTGLDAEGQKANLRCTA